ncbi:MAG: hypothetical protein H7124_18495, partial [Phycisphaerales bacterium]|nr:hypothetical protein [Hyphomonadaceae bacterium]
MALALLWIGLPLLLAQAFVPFDEFVRRGDDAYYYFQIAANYPQLGFWSFDGTQSTNGVQPLWAMLLSAVAQLAAWIGVTDRDVLSRVFVGVAAIMQFGAALMLFHLLAARTTVGTAFVAAGATIFPIGFVWGRLWGVESPLLALAIVSVAAYYELRVRASPTVARAAVVGLLLGVTCLSRLNAGLLAPCLGLWMLLDRRAGTTLGERWRHAMVAAAATAVVVLPYLAWNLVTTDALLPISGQVKAVGVSRALEEFGAEGSHAWQVASYVLEHWKGAVLWFVSSRSLDGLWVTGLRVVHDSAGSVASFTVALALLLGAPALLGRGWWATLRARTGQLAPFGYIAAFAVVDALVSVAVFPTQSYAITRWWLVSAETVLAVLTATILVAAMAHAGRLVLPRWRAAFA